MNCSILISENATLLLNVGFYKSVRRNSPYVLNMTIKRSDTKVIVGI